MPLQLEKRHPDVKLYLGTFNTNRLDHVEKVLSDSLLRESIEGVAFNGRERDTPGNKEAISGLQLYMLRVNAETVTWTGRRENIHSFLLPTISETDVTNGYNWNFLLPKQGYEPLGMEAERPY